VLIYGQDFSLVVVGVVDVAGVVILQDQNYKQYEEEREEREELEERED
jgi:hypothetical protein